MKCLWMVILVLVCGCVLFAQRTISNEQKPEANVGSAIVPDTSDDSLSPDTFIRVDSMPVMIKEVTPVYPEADKKAGTQGRVWVKMLVNKQGIVRNALVLKREKGSIAMEEAALTACRQDRFTPAKVNGKPIAIWVSLSIVFTLSDKPENK